MRAREVLLWVALALVAGCTRPAAPVAPAAPAPDMTMRQVTVRSYRGSSLHLVATAPHVEVLRATMDLWARDAGLFLPDHGGTLGARTVKGNLQAGHFEGHDGVTLATRDGLAGSSPSVAYERPAGSRGIASSDAGVRLAHPRFTHEADGFWVDLAQQRATFDRPRTVALPAARP